MHVGSDVSLRKPYRGSISAWGSTGILLDICGRVSVAQFENDTVCMCMCAYLCGLMHVHAFPQPGKSMSALLSAPLSMVLGLFGTIRLCVCMPVPYVSAWARVFLYVYVCELLRPSERRLSSWHPHTGGARKFTTCHA